MYYMGFQTSTTGLLTSNNQMEYESSFPAEYSLYLCVNNALACKKCIVLPLVYDKH